MTILIEESSGKILGYYNDGTVRPMSGQRVRQLTFDEALVVPERLKEGPLLDDSGEIKPASTFPPLHTLDAAFSALSSAAKARTLGLRLRIQEAARLNERGLIPLLIRDFDTTDPKLPPEVAQELTVAKTEIIKKS